MGNRNELGIGQHQLGLSIFSASPRFVDRDGVVEPVVDLDLGLDHGLSEDEFKLACEILDRTPSYTELGIFSAMWSEHCSYKSSKFYLRQFPTTGEQVLIGPGENAGAVDVGDGLAVIFKMESHNHPSFIEPYQGAATGVGGILRDVFTMGARPIANLNALRFGTPNTAHMKYLIRRVTQGIGDYGNCVGIPTVGGEVFFDSAYQGNILVNAMTVGLAKADQIFLGQASGPGNAVMYVGSKTGRDGIHGATMASEEFSEESEEKRPTVQVGDPFTEKLLLEALMELFPTGKIIGIQDMGAAGLTSSSFEMAGRAGSGLDLDLGKVPTREAHMSSYEIMLSESQERMLLVCLPDDVAAIRAVFEKWDLEAEVVGVVTDTGRVRITSPEGELVADMPAAPLADQAPMYERPWSEPAQFAIDRATDVRGYGFKSSVTESLKRLLQSPNIASKRWFYRQYDHTVRTDTVAGPGSEAALVRIKGTDKAIAITTDCNPRLVKLDPYQGGAMAVAEAARNIACTGAKPLAITDCLNFGSPENPEVMWQFKESIRGMSDACRALDTPVISGNVSFYNETNGSAVLPTPAVGMVGLLADRSVYATNVLAESGLSLFLLGAPTAGLGGSEFLDTEHGLTTGALTPIDLDLERRLLDVLQSLVSNGLVRHARDCSEGGLAVTLAEMCFGPHRIGLDVDLQADGSVAETLFGEGPSRVVVAVAAEDEERFQASCGNVPWMKLGRSGGQRCVIKINGKGMVDEPIDALASLWQDAIPNVME
ncbi:MAG: phosphoribosylformylglycinamidine synthase subunit PurL [Acidobacteria bacterium]|nr:phosphoribosylformylglycinamidine synthase subunit PurL [Acidobacteriota bacterium]